MSVLIHPATTEDLVWVRCSWLASYRDHTAHRMVRSMPGCEYSQRWRRVIAAMLESCSTMVASHSQAPDTVLGWVCYEPGRLHYVHVRREVQRKHIARDLVDAAGFDATRPLLYSHRTTCSDLIPMPAHWEWAPWLVIGA